MHSRRTKFSSDMRRRRIFVQKATLTLSKKVKKTPGWHHNALLGDKEAQPWFGPIGNFCISFTLASLKMLLFSILPNCRILIYFEGRKFPEIKKQRNFANISLANSSFRKHFTDKTCPAFLSRCSNKNILNQSPRLDFNVERRKTQWLRSDGKNFQFWPSDSLKNDPVSNWFCQEMRF